MEQKATTAKDAGEVKEGALGIGSLARMEVAGIPIGGVVVGAAVSGLVDGIIGMIEGKTGRALPVWAAKGLACWAILKWGPRWLGEGAKYAGVILAVDAGQSIWNIRAAASGLFAKAAGTVTGVGATKPGEIVLPPELLGATISQEEYEAAKRGMH
ncbi:MAG: hypothetical protein CVV27_02650 [Candidatus Melainabacteria bacterium HGW-Melainabacteria-1]|nr:MAG: hypothetical protein CVV27_02650 [Candidatus Melainabacteria bacterium HGW-Melainabacteria-1]